jgi:predicted nucleic acid-binding protein
MFSIAASKGTIISYQVIDITGKTVRTQNGIKQSMVTVTTEGLAAGMYLVRFETSEGTGAANLILE